MTQQLEAAGFREVWLADFEFTAPPGERPNPICLVALEFNSGRLIRLWQDNLQQLEKPPYSVGSDSLLVAYYASAEINCHLALGWPPPLNVLDLYVEFSNLTNCKSIPCGRGLLGALTYYGLDAMAAVEKKSMQQLAMRGGPFTEEEKEALIDYCEVDVRALQKLLPRMLPEILGQRYEI